MGQVEATVVTGFKSLRKGLRLGAQTDRRGLDNPRDIKNMLVDEHGHLWMPPAPDHSIADISALGGAAGPRVKKIAHTRGGFFFHIGDETYVDDSQAVGSITQAASLSLDFTWGTKEPSDPLLAPAAGEDHRAKRFSWINDVGDKLMGNELETWKRVGTSWTDESAANKQGPHSIVYKGRRFVAGGNVNGLRTVWFSELNQPESFLADNYFILEGDTGAGSTLERYTGHVVGMEVWEDLLVIFASQSIWVLDGTDPDNFNLRRTASPAGCLAIESVVEVEQGLMFFGGIPEGETGVYLFTGNAAQLVSGDISWFFREWDAGLYEAIPASADQTNRNAEEDEAEWYFNAVRWGDYYVLCAPTVAGDRELYVYNLKTRTWTTFAGWGTFPRMGLEKKYYHPYALIIGNYDGRLWRATTGFPRPPVPASGTPVDASFTLGWHDDGHTTGFRRFLGVKLSGRFEGTGTPTISMTATTSEGASVTEVENIPADVFSSLVVPINLRGNAVEMEFTITPANDDNEVLIEQVELVHSLKGQKLSRV